MGDPKTPGAHKMPASVLTTDSTIMELILIIPQQDEDQFLYELRSFLYKKSTRTFSNRIYLSKLNIVDFSY